MGRYYGLGRDTIEETTRLTIDDLRTWGCLHEGFCRKHIKLMRGEEETGSLNFEVHIKDPRSYIKFDYLLDKKPVSYEHEIELFPCYFGRHRCYFRCRHCRRRVTALYLSGGYYACRHCHNLAYETSQAHRTLSKKIDQAYSLRTRAKKLREYHHPRKANRLLRRADELEAESWIDVARWLGMKGKL